MKQDGKFVCKCECGGSVRGVEQFNRLFTWCTKCTPVVTFTPPRAGAVPTAAPKQDPK